MSVQTLTFPRGLHEPPAGLPPAPHPLRAAHAAARLAERYGAAAPAAVLGDLARRLAAFGPAGPFPAWCRRLPSGESGERYAVDLDAAGYHGLPRVPVVFDRRRRRVVTVLPEFYLTHGWSGEAS